MNPTSSEELINMLSLNNPSYQNFLNQRLEIVKQLKKRLDNKERVLLVSNDLHMPQSATVVTLDKLYGNFALGHVMNKLTGIKIPYTINYFSIISHDYRIESVWEGDIAEKRTQE